MKIDGQPFGEVDLDRVPHPEPFAWKDHTQRCRFRPGRGRRTANAIPQRLKIWSARPARRPWAPRTSKPLPAVPSRNSAGRQRLPDGLHRVLFEGTAGPRAPEQAAGQLFPHDPAEDVRARSVFKGNLKPNWPGPPIRDRSTGNPLYPSCRTLQRIPVVHLDFYRHQKKVILAAAARSIWARRTTSGTIAVRCGRYFMRPGGNRQLYPGRGRGGLPTGQKWRLAREASVTSSAWSAMRTSEPAAWIRPSWNRSPCRSKGCSRPLRSAPAEVHLRPQSIPGHRDPEHAIDQARRGLLGGTSSAPAGHFT